MKRRMTAILCALLVLALYVSAGASGLTMTDSADVLEEASQFPFFAETDELAVNLRAQTNTKSEKVSRLERGTQVTVLAAELNQSGEVWYLVELADSTQGYIRSDLLVETQMAENTDETAPVQEADELRLIGNEKTKKYHEPGCKSLPAEKNQVFFDSADEAENAGYVHCKNCD